MVEVLVSAAAGSAAGAVVWRACRPWLASAAFARPNYRDKVIPSSAGLVFPLALLAVEALRAVAVAGRSDPGLQVGRLLTVLVVSGFCLLGLVDDVAGTARDRGFRGHLRALRDGRVTTGLVKLVGGAAVALVAVGIVVGDSVPRLLADAALVALCANLGNLFDRGPGRAGKAALVAFVLLVAGTGGDPALAAVAVVMGAAAALLIADLREELMLGDAGANVLGAALGFGAVVTMAPATRTVLLVVVAALDLYGEVGSFSKLIAAVAPLRAADRFGRRP